MSVLLIDRSDRLRMQFSGSKVAESLTGLVTNDVLSLRGGQGLYACALTPKGKIIADLRIAAEGDADGAVTTLHVDCNAAAGPGFAAMIRKYVNPRTARYVDVTASTGCVSLIGDGAVALLTAAAELSEASASLFANAAAFTHAAVQIATVPCRALIAPDLGAETPVLDLFCDRSGFEALCAALLATGAENGTMHQWHQRRIAAARPEWGVDMDESTLAQEANMDALMAISYQKGCYTGQETVARVHFRGHVNRTLRAVRYAAVVTPASGTPILAADGTEVGDSRSVITLSSGITVGIAMLRRSVGSGAQLHCVDAWSAASVELTVLDDALP